MRSASPNLLGYFVTHFKCVEKCHIEQKSLLANIAATILSDSIVHTQQLSKNLVKQEEKGIGRHLVVDMKSRSICEQFT
jgi:hypothetical protein